MSRSRSSTRIINELAPLVKPERDVVPLLERKRSAKREESLTVLLWRNRGWVLLILDTITIVSSFILSYYVGLHLRFFGIETPPLSSLSIYINGALLLAFIWVSLIWKRGGYKNGLRGLGAPMLRLRSLFMAGVYALGFMIVIAFLVRGILLPRFVYLMTGILAGSIMILFRLLFHDIDVWLAKNGIITHRLVIVGTGHQAREFAGRLKKIGGGIQPAGFVRLRSDLESQNDQTLGYEVLGELDELKSIYRDNPFEKLVLSASVWMSLQQPAQKDKITAVLNFCEAKNISLYTLPELLNTVVTMQEVASLSDTPLIKLQDATLHPAYAFVKRFIDILVSILGIVLGMPLWLIIGLVIKRSSKGPVFFTQTRIGIHGKAFKIYKFRTMVEDAENRLKDLIDIKKLDVPGFKIRSDPRVTPVGRFLRRFSLDEFPQLINVLRGDMSLVGPRPELPELVEMYTPEQRRRLKAKPGITGYQQIIARGEPLAGCHEYDLIYLKYQSFLFDMYILLRTVFAVLSGRGVTH